MEDACDPGPVPGSDARKASQLRFAVVLTAVVFAGELVGGWLTGSLALLSDAWHVCSDVVALSLSLFAIGIACRPPTTRHSYGLHRVEVLVALANGAVLTLIAAGILWEAYHRFVEPGPIRSVPMLVVALVGLVANAVVALRLGGHSHDDLNLRSAYLHVIGDLLASVGVVVAAVVIALTGWVLADPIVSAGIAVLIAAAAFRVVRESLHILLEGVPEGLELEQVVQSLEQVKGVESVHHVQAWSLCSNVLAFSAHVVTCPGTDDERRALRGELEHVLVGRWGFAHTTLELECDPPCPPGLLKTFEHDEARGNGNGHNHDHEGPGHHHGPGETH